MQNYGLQQNLSTCYRRSFAVYRMYRVKIYKANHPTTLLLFPKSFKWWVISPLFTHLSPAHFITGLAMNLCQWRGILFVDICYHNIYNYCFHDGRRIVNSFSNVSIIFRRAKGMVKNVRFKMNTFQKKTRNVRCQIFKMSDFCMAYPEMNGGVLRYYI